jgi:uncharacterized protein YutD
MEKIIVVDDKKYQIIEDYKDGYDDTEFKLKLTEFFDDYDYIVGDWAYGKLRLKGFYDKGNNKVKDLNNYDKVKDYLQNNCAYGCKYFIAKRVYKN